MNQQYVKEYSDAVSRADSLGVGLPPVQVIVRKNCVEMARLTPVLQKFLGQWTAEQVAARSLEMNVKLIPVLSAQLGIPFTLTGGWFDHGGRQVYRHDESFLREIIQGLKSGQYLTGIPMHFWLTSPAFEVLDVCLYTLIAQATRNPELSGGIIYYSNETPAPEILYHPTIVGEAFLEKIGATVNLG